MCGIVGIVNEHPVAQDLVTALGRLEYRGYDSAGIAVVGEDLDVCKVIGGATVLRAALGRGFMGHAGIGHTRWATHGRAEVRNAHPHVHDGVAVVHNGIIENHQQHRAALAQAGHSFLSETDSEVIAHLIANARRDGASPVLAVRIACAQLHGSFAVAVVFADAPDRILVARRGSPVMVARGARLSAVASDPAALAGACEEYAALRDGDIAELFCDMVVILTADGRPVTRAWQRIEAAEEQQALGSHGSFTRAEIAAQPAALHRTDAALRGRRIVDVVAAAERLVIVACGSSLFAAAAVRPMLEKLTGLPCDLEIASEYRTREAPLARNTVAVLVSQSGETADTLAVMAMLRGKAVPIVAVVNVPHSQMAQAADLLWPTSAGREQGVAATKSFTCQMLALIRFGMALGEVRGTIGVAELDALEHALAAIASTCAATETLETRLAYVAQRIVVEGEALFIGRGPAAWLAAEGALKLKELSYLRAEAYAAGELKHGPIALVREGSPVIVCAGADQFATRTLANTEEVRARGAYVIALVDEACAADFAAVADEVVVLPGCGIGTLFAQAVAVQLLAVHAASWLGNSVDRPRNLAKSVTVE